MGRTEFLGCTITFVADNGIRLVQAEIDQCGGEGKAFIQIQDDCPDDVDCQGKQFLISDSTLKDSDCAACRWNQWPSEAAARRMGMEDMVRLRAGTHDEAARIEKVARAGPATR